MGHWVIEPVEVDMSTTVVGPRTVGFPPRAVSLMVSVTTPELNENPLLGTSTTLVVLLGSEIGAVEVVPADVVGIVEKASVLPVLEMNIDIENGEFGRLVVTEPAVVPEDMDPAELPAAVAIVLRNFVIGPLGL